MSVQIVGYDARVTGPATLVVAEDGEVDTVALERGNELTYTLGDRHCAGQRQVDRHVTCSAPEAPYCDLHTDRWPCARCTGECTLPIENCEREHVVYLAAFAPATFKVGVTKSDRLETRLREQGADRGAHLRTVKDGRIARQIEAELAAEVGDRVRVPTKIDGFHESVDEVAWDALFESYEHEERYAFEYDLGLAGRPQQETLASGTVRGAKGRVLVLENAGSVYAVDLRDLVGYEIGDGTPDRDLQSSLGAFE